MLARVIVQYKKSEGINSEIYIFSVILKQTSNNQNTNELMEGIGLALDTFQGRSPTVDIISIIGGISLVHDILVYKKSSR